EIIVRSAIRDPRWGGRWRRDGLRHRRSPRTVVGRRILHIHEERRGAAARGVLPLALLRVLPGFFAILAANRERQRPQPLLADFLAAVEAVAVGAVLEARERVDDLIERLRLHLHERE